MEQKKGDSFVLLSGVSGQERRPNLALTIMGSSKCELCSSSSSPRLLPPQFTCCSALVAVAVAASDASSARSTRVRVPEPMVVEYVPLSTLNCPNATR